MTRDRPRPPRSDGSGQLYAVLPRELGDVLPADTEGADRVCLRLDSVQGDELANSLRSRRPPHR